MTRYTKLENKPAAQATDFFGDSIAKSSTSPAAKPAFTKTARVHDQLDVEAAQNSTAEAPPVSAELMDPRRLLKRAKLLRLKVKKAGTTAAAQLRARQWKVEAADCEKRAASGSGAKDGNRVSTTTTARPRTEKPKPAVRGSTAQVSEQNPWKKMEFERRANALDKSAARREARVAARAATTTCYACRGRGHAARDCTSMLNASAVALDSEAQGAAASDHDADPSTISYEKVRGQETVGICFRCGSEEHTLARCRRPTPRVGSALPFARCFVCKTMGHLSSACPHNTSRGLYPNGGSCALCRSVQHLARDCSLRRESAVNAGAHALSNSEVSAGQSRTIAVGADEDDFHDLARRQAELERTLGDEDRADRKVSGRKRLVDEGGPDVVRNAPPKEQKARKVVAF